MAKIRQSNLDNSIVTGLTELAEGAASTDVVLVYDASTGTLKKITQTNLLNFPTISSVSPTNAFLVMVQEIYIYYYRNRIYWSNSNITYKWGIISFF
jgi:hypothetical protein